jgi:hypothetical protein
MIKFLAIPKFRLLLAARYPVIFIDEYQDMNKDLDGGWTAGRTVRRSLAAYLWRRVRAC